MSGTTGVSKLVQRTHNGIIGSLVYFWSYQGMCYAMFLPDMHSAKIIRDRLRKGGNNIFAFEIESSISRHPEIADVSVTPVSV